MMNEHAERVAQATGLTLDQVVQCLSASERILAEADGALMQLDRSSTDPIERWWEIFVRAIENGILRSGEDFRVDGNQLFLRWNRCHSVYLLHHRVYADERGLGSKPMLDLVRTTPAFLRMVKSMKLQGANSSAVAFNIDQLPASTNKALDQC